MEPSPAAPGQGPQGNPAAREPAAGAASWPRPGPFPGGKTIKGELPGRKRGSLVGGALSVPYFCAWLPQKPHRAPHTHRQGIARWRAHRLESCFCTAVPTKKALLHLSSPAAWARATWLASGPGSPNRAVTEPAKIADSERAAPTQPEEARVLPDGSY